MVNLFRNHLKKSLLLIMLPLLLLLSQQAIAKEEACKELKPINNLDELLYQFYVNLDSDCLFTMPLGELEKVWEVEVLPETRLNDVTDNPIRFKPYHSEIDAFIVFASSEGSKTTGFEIVMTSEYSKKHGTLFPTGNPEGLPTPSNKIIESLFEIVLRGSHCGKFYPRRGEYIQGVLYYWLNTEQTRMIYFLADPCGGVSKISFGKLWSEHLN